MLTLEEIKERLAERIDEVGLLEVLEIDSYMLVERFADIIEANIEKYADLVDDGEDTDEA